MKPLLITFDANYIPLNDQKFINLLQEGNLKLVLTDPLLSEVLSDTNNPIKKLQFLLDYNTSRILESPIRVAYKEINSLKQYKPHFLDCIREKEIIKEFQKIIQSGEVNPEFPSDIRSLKKEIATEVSPTLASLKQEGGLL